MRFACEQCGKSYATKDVPLPGRVYRIKCKNCGKVLVVKGPDATSSPAQPETAPAPSGSWPAEARRSTSPSAVPSAVTPLSDLVAPPAPPDAAAPAMNTPASPPHATAPEPQAAPPSAPAAARGAYVELFDESDVRELDATPTPTPTRAAAPPPLPPAPASPPLSELPPLPAVAPASEEEFRNVAESLRQSLPPDDPFERVRDEFEPVAELAEPPIPPASSLGVEPPSRPAPAKPEARSRPPAHRPAARGSHRGLAVAIGSLAAVVVLAGVGFVVLRSRPAAPRPSPRTATVPRAPATPPRHPAPAVRASAPEPSSTRPERAEPAVATEPKPAPDESTVAVQITPEPPPAPAAAPPPHRAEAKPPARPHPAPAKKPEKPEKVEKQQPRPAKAPERSDRTVAAAERHEPSEPAPAAAQPADADEPSGLAPEQIQRVLGGARRAFDACLRDPWRGLEQPPGPRQIALRFVVAPEGTVNYPTIDDVTISSAPVGQCLKAAARGLTFPSFQGDPVKVDAPITIPVK